MSLEAALDVLMTLKLEDGRFWGEVAESFQIEDARAVLDPETTQPYQFLTRPRGGSKTSDQGAICIAALVTQLPSDSRSIGAAADKDQARLLRDAAAGFVRRTTSLQSLFEIGTYRITYRPTGASLDILASDAPGAWGLRFPLAVVDEVAQWPETSGPKTFFEAITSAAAKSSTSRLVLLTTAGSPNHWSRRVLDHAITDPLWRVNEVSGPVPWVDPDRLEEQRRRLPESSFRRLFLNEWVESEDTLTSIEDLKACVVLDGPLDWQPEFDYVVGLDLGFKRDRTCAAICHAERSAAGSDLRRVVLDRMTVWEGSRKDPVPLAVVEEWLLQASRAYHARIIVDPWQAAGLAQRLRSRGIDVTEFAFSSSSVGRLATALHLALRNRALALPDDPALFDELSRVRLRETTPGVYRLDHAEGQHDDRAVALGLCVVRLMATDEAIPVAVPVEIPKAWSPRLTHQFTGASEMTWPTH